MKASVFYLFATCATWPMAAMAQSGGSGGVEEIVVTAQKRAESLQDVPLSISAISSSQIEQRGITGLGAFLQTPPPGVIIQPFAGSQSLLIIDMRGVANSDPGQGTVELGTAVYIDDVYLGRAQGLGTDLVDPERIEVLRGPQGTLFGRNAEGGAIRIVTKKPTGEFGGDAKVSIGNYGLRRYEAHVNLPEIAGFSIKLDYLNTDHGGYTKNPGPRIARLESQRDYGEFAGEGYRASVRWQPSDRVVVDYAYDHARTEEVYDWYVLAAPPVRYIADGGTIAPLATLSGARPLNESISRRTKTAWTSLYNAPFITKTSGHTLQAEFDLSDSLKLRSISAYRETDAQGANQLGGAFNLSRLPAGQTAARLVPGLGLSLGVVDKA